MQAIIENKDGWDLQSLNINRYSYDKSAPYQGKITFSNGHGDSLGFSIPPEKMAPLLALIADSVVDSANKLGHRMAASVQETLKQTAPAIEYPVPPDPELNIDNE